MVFVLDRIATVSMSLQTTPANDWSYSNRALPESCRCCCSCRCYHRLFFYVNFYCSPIRSAPLRFVYCACAVFCAFSVCLYALWFYSAANDIPYIVPFARLFSSSFFATHQERKLVCSFSLSSRCRSLILLLYSFWTQNTWSVTIFLHSCSLDSVFVPTYG